MMSLFFPKRPHLLRSGAWRAAARSLASLLLAVSLLPAAAQPADEGAATPAGSVPETVVIAGTVQSVLGCPGDWQPDCTETALTFDAQDQLWSATFTLPAGEYEYKAALNESWDENYGANAARDGANIPLVLTEETDVRFLFQPSSGWVADSVNHLIANVPGNYQDEIGCGEEWAPGCLRSLLTDIDGDGVYTYTAEGLPAGPYEAKVALNESWALNYGEGGAQNGANLLFVVGEDGQAVEFVFSSETNVMTISVGGQTAPAVGNLFLSRALWLTADTIAWDTARIPGAEYTLHVAAEGGLVLTDQGVEGGEAFALTLERGGLTDDLIAAFPPLADDYFALRLPPDAVERVRELVRGQLAISTRYTGTGGLVLGDATGVQIWGVLDSVFAAGVQAETPLGPQFPAEGAPSLHVWAPTASNVSLVRFEPGAPDADAVVSPMTADAETGIWSIAGEPDWYGDEYLFEVTVYAPAAQAVVTHRVTDPYSLALTANSARSVLLSLDDPATQPAGWAENAKPPLASFADVVLYELHIRDFSMNDPGVPDALRGTYAAFTAPESAGMAHLTALAQAGLTHIHLLPSFDIATIEEIAADREEPDPAALAAFPPDSDEQQALIEPLRDRDGFNWGYDPYHFTTPEGSYSTDPASPAARIREYRAMVQALNAAGLRVVMDVVYNHTNAAGLGDRSVLDRIVPGYYHRYTLDGRIETSTCCQNTATEHAMMQRLMLDSLRVWATAYQIDGFRFDLMGHHMREDLIEVRAMLDSLTPETDGVDGSRIFVYGEGWNFGEVADGARGVNATQQNMAGTGIATFNDRLRDAVRGGNPFGGWQEQGFATGLFVLPNEVEARPLEEQAARLNAITDWIEVGLAGGLRQFPIVRADGEIVSGAEIDYNGQPAGYTASPLEQIVYVAAHDNETLFDAVVLKAPLEASMAERVRMHNLAIDLAMFAQGVPFFHAGDDLLRSKSLDRNSYNSGDWFNIIDWTGQVNGFGRGLPPASDNADNYPIFAPLLANPDLMPTPDDIAAARDHFRESLQIRRSLPLMRLETADDVLARMAFIETGIPGVIAYTVDGAGLDGAPARIVVVFNATPAVQTVSADGVPGAFTLHPVQAGSADPVVREAAFGEGAFTVPGLTTAVFVAG
jgi:pullulanase-type alpha-1,6-glucosidase